jgi:hypothetical protein
MLWIKSKEWSRASEGGGGVIFCPFSNVSDEVIHVFSLSFSMKVKKGIPLQAWTGPEGSSRLRLPDFKTVGT